MTEDAQSFAPSLAELSKPDWVQAVAEVCEENGAFEPLGDRHFAALIEEDTTLIVTFETVQGIQALSEVAQPFGWEMLEALGWSTLCIASDGDTWFRDPGVYAYFDRLVDDGFFDEFETVIFYGAGPCAYAASAYSVAAPGARALLIQPQATLDPRVTEWDDRFVDMRRTDFTSRYGYGPDMLEAAETAYVLYDPYEELDAMHAALFTRPNVTKFRMPHMGAALQTDLMEMGELAPLLQAISEDRLDTQRFARAFRARRDHRPYLRNLLARLEAGGREALMIRLLRSVTARLHDPRFERKLKNFETG
ncbi:MAG: phosphoadenosine phosphosulfate reductase [Pseudomonadota bacterium]